MSIRTRFAPSPTGYLHIGGARTALYCYLYAHKHKGAFILRIEDTDVERSTKEYEYSILEAMQWLGLQHDEGPFYQMQRMSRYEEFIQLLLQQGKAYRCYCSKERLEKLRETQIANKEKPRYDGHCRHLLEKASNESYVIRFCNPEEGVVEFDDLIHGKLSFRNIELDDLVIKRSDGSPTYNFCVVVDDWDMNISHVIRGDDHINNTPRQINIFKALGVTPPQYAHVPMILGSDGKRLSKRHGAVSVLEYREQGYLPHALLNYLVRLGWSHGDQELFSMQEMIEYFDFNSVNKAPAAFNPDKLIWLNQHYLKSYDPKVIVPYLKWHMENLEIDISSGPTLEEIIIAQRERVKTLKEMAIRSRYFFEEFTHYDEQAIAKNFTAETPKILSTIAQALQNLSAWQTDAIHQVLTDTAQQLNVKLGNVAQPIRIAITGSTVSPPIDSTLHLLGKTRVLQRLQKAIKYWETRD